MKTTVNTASLKKALAQVKPVMGRSSLDILKSIKLGEGTLCATNGETWVEVPVECEGEGHRLYGYQLLSRIAKSIPNETIQFEDSRLTTDSIDIVLGFSDDTAEWPEPPTVEGEPIINVIDWKTQTKGLIHTMSSDKCRLILTGLRLDKDLVGAHFVTTDTHRLRFETTEADKSAMFSRSFVDIMRIIDGPVTIIGNGARFEAKKDGITIVGSALAGTYPNWQRVVPEKPTNEYTVDRKALQCAVKRALMFAKDNANRVIFKFDDVLTIRALAEDIGEYKESMRWDSRTPTTGKIELALNGHYLLDVLANTKDEIVKFEMTKCSRPVRFTGEGWSEVIMPMALA